MDVNIDGMKPGTWVVLLLITGLLGCETVDENVRDSENDWAPELQGTITSRATQLIRMLKAGKYEDLAQWVHPKRGVRFSPSPHIYGGLPVFSRDQVSTLSSKGQLWEWGGDDFSDPISMEFSRYHDRFIYDRDFLNSDSVFFNYNIQRGNVLNNLTSAFGRDCIVVEYYIPGEPQYSDMDWRSLRLVFAPHQDDWYLVGVVHSQWSI